MNKLFVLALLSSFVSSIFSQSIDEIALIRVDQFGYYEDQIKIAVLADPQLGINASDSYTPSDNIVLKDASNDETVLELTKTVVNGGNIDVLSGDKLWQIDFSSFNTPGTYYILDETEGIRSHEFSIGGDNYEHVLRAAVKQLYYQRCGHSRVASRWSDAPSHLQDTACYDYHGNLATRDLSGGWMDAGDYAKYVGFAYPAVHDLASAYLVNPEFWNDFNTDIPESNNNKPDILDELQWELDWLLKMQVEEQGDNSLNGGILHTVSMVTDEGNYWSKHVNKPASEDASKRFFLGVTGQATCTGASMFAYSAYAFQKAGLTNDADIYIGAAEKAWTWTENNISDTNSNFENYPADQMDPYLYGKDMIYGTVTIALFETACYLHLLTGDSKYLTYLQNNINDIPENGNLRGALMNYALDPAADQTIAEEIKTKCLNLWGKPGTWHFKENGSDLTDGHNYLNWSPYWGGNVFLSREAALVYNCSKFDNNNMDWRNKVISSAASFMHGCNPLDLIYMTEVGGSYFGGERYLEVFYHGDSNMKNLPPPGCIPGGPNGSFQGTSSPLPANSPGLKRFDPSQEASPAYQYFEGQIKMQAAYVYLMSTIISAYGPATPTTTSITSSSSASNFAYPNPTNDLLYLSEETSWTLYDTSGRVLISGNSKELNLSNLSTGVYILETNGKTQKIIKN